MRVFVSVVCLFVSTQAAWGQAGGSAAELDPTLPYQAERVNPVTYDVDFSVVVTPPYKTKKLKVWLPLPMSDAGQEVTEGEMSAFPLRVRPQIGTEETYGNKFAYFEFDAPQGAQIVRHRFRVKVWELRWNVQAERVQGVSQWPSSFDKYRRGDAQSVVVDERFEKLLGHIAPGETNPTVGLTGVMRWVQDNFAYDHHDASLRASAEHALEKRRGHCSDYHGFCASMGACSACRRA
ncbi:MAG: transglutaminase domain-containing protein [Pirellulales bacterium]